MKPVKDVMQNPSFTQETDTLQTAVSLMNASHLEFLPVVDKNLQVVGTITSKDLAKINAQKLQGMQVSDVMKKACSINTNDDEAAALKLMRNCQTPHLPVVDERNQLKGVVSFMTLARRIIRIKQELRREHQRLKARRNFGLSA